MFQSLRPSNRAPRTSPMERLTRWSAPFRACRDGGVMLVAALAAVPMVVVVSLAIDFSRASTEKARLDIAVDSASLYAATKAATHGSAADFHADEAAAKSYFNAAIAPARDGLTVSALSIQIQRDPNDPTLLKAVASYTATLETSFVRSFKPEIEISGTASASIPIPSYVDFYLLLDHSPSMGLAATQADIDKLVQLTGGCEFACHTVYRNGTSDPNDNLAIAQRNGVTLRIDLLRNATQALTQTAQQTQQKSGLANQFRMGVYGFNSDVSVFSSHQPNSNRPDNGLIADLAAVGTSAQGLQLTPYTDDGNFFLTDFVKVFQTMGHIVTAPGDGSTSASPRKFVFFVTDGVQDLPLHSPHGSNDPKYTQYDNTWGWGHAIAPIDPTICSAIKNTGVTIAVLYTPFLATSAGDSPLSDHDVALWKDDIPIKLKQCATAGFFYQADSSGIASAMAQMFQDALRAARLTN